MTEQNYTTVAGDFETEQMIQKSRFIARVYPVKSEAEAAQIVADVKKEHYKATHVCSAWVLHTVPVRQKASDDGEPSGTAGRPMLDVLLRRGLSNILVVVIRYFGGVKLGAGGLVRAYAGSCAQVLDAARLISWEVRARVTVETEYALYQGLKQKLEADGDVPVEERFTEMVALDFLIDPEAVADFEARIRDYTNDSFLFERGPVERVACPVVEGGAQV